MKSRKKQHETTIVLELTEAEASWLKGYMQNYMGGYGIETAEGEEMRRLFWEELTIQGVKA